VALMLPIAVAVLVAWLSSSSCGSCWASRWARLSGAFLDADAEMSFHPSWNVLMNFQEGRQALLEQPQFQVPFLLDYLAVFPVGDERRDRRDAQAL
jgi:hypothetical protein